ncbi:BTB/POZ domain-containing protein 3-like [Pseudoliparis swirei]|uniref:BTB/POZ domain-containing protein 3-like n=1 Tax=Pseudoliparis swirei TaxID=2059687 RepID=UPI0024BE31FF|nr:BTB/POZ domain-containing protein 3-like [Pseudoliparis swirei]
MAAELFPTKKLVTSASASSSTSSSSSSSSSSIQQHQQQNLTNNNTSTAAQGGSSWQGLFPTIRERNSVMFNNETMADVHFVVGPPGGTERVPGHKRLSRSGQHVGDWMRRPGRTLRVSAKAVCQIPENSK